MGGSSCAVIFLHRFTSHLDSTHGLTQMERSLWKSNILWTISLKVVATYEFNYLLSNIFPIKCQFLSYVKNCRTIRYDHFRSGVHTWSGSHRLGLISLSHFTKTCLFQIYILGIKFINMNFVLLMQLYWFDLWVVINIPSAGKAADACIVVCSSLATITAGVCHNEGGLGVAVNPYAGGGQFCQYKMMQKPEKWLKPWHMGTHLRVLI